MALNDFEGMSLSLAADFTDYSNVEIDFESDGLFEDELAENEFINNVFTSVWNLRGGISYDLNEFTSIRGGYAYQPSRFQDGVDDRNIYSGGFGFDLGQGTSIELGGIYMRWEEESSVYTYTEYDYSPLPDESPLISGTRSEDALRAVDFFQLMGTIRFSIN